MQHHRHAEAPKNTIREINDDLSSVPVGSRQIRVRVASCFHTERIEIARDENTAAAYCTSPSILFFPLQARHTCCDQRPVARDRVTSWAAS